MILGRLERYIWEQDTRLFNVAIVVPVGVLLPLEREEKRKACSTIHSRFQIDKTTTLCAKRFILCLFNSLFIYLFIYLFHSYSTGYSLSHRRDSLQTLQETIGATFCYYYYYIFVVSIERNV